MPLKYPKNWASKRAPSSRRSPISPPCCAAEPDPRDLRAKRAEIGGYIHDLEKKTATWRARLAHIDATIRIFSPETDPEAIPPRRTYRRSGYFKPGELARLCLDELRKADGTALATAAIARNILDGKKLPHDPDLVAIVADRLQGYLRERAKRGDVIKAGKRRDAQWALAPALV